jgi:hypothetical protein
MRLKQWWSGLVAAMPGGLVNVTAAVAARYAQDKDIRPRDCP